MRLLVVLLGLIGCGGGSNQTHPIPGDKGAAITVEVLNAGGRPGSARIGTRILRQAGIDVVYFGNAVETTGALDSTRIIVRRGEAKVGERVRAALGQGRVAVQLDGSKLVDVSVLLGADFAPSRPRASLDLHP